VKREVFLEGKRAQVENGTPEFCASSGKKGLNKSAGKRKDDSEQPKMIDVKQSDERVDRVSCPKRKSGSNGTNKRRTERRRAPFLGRLKKKLNVKGKKVTISKNEELAAVTARYTGKEKALDLFTEQPLSKVTWRPFVIKILAKPRGNGDGRPQISGCNLSCAELPKTTNTDNVV